MQPSRDSDETAGPRPIQQRRGRRRWGLLPHASDSQGRLQLAADRAASKRFGDSRNRGKAGLGARRPAAERVDDAPDLEIRHERVRH
jgi:hypothetical protein